MFFSKADFQSWVRAAAGAVAALAIGVAATPEPAQAQSADGRYEVVVSAGKSEVLELPDRYTDLMIADPAVADVLPLSTRSVYVVGKKLGSTALNIYGPGKRLLASINVVVTPDLTGLKARMHDVAPGESGVRISPANDSIVLSGTVSSGPRAQQLVALAETFAPGKVVNMMTVQGSQQVMLTVRFVEMERGLAKQFRVNAATPSVGIPNGTFDIVPGRSYIQMGDSVSGQDRFGIFTGVIRNGDLNLDILVDAVETKGLAKTLAEPTLVAMSGDTASFLAGGEFPVPISSENDDKGATITVEFKQFGISLAFTPTVLQDGIISLVVAPEVSSLDPTASVTTGGIVIPGLKVRRARTTVELRDGESFTIAGLLRDEYRNDIRQFPFLGDLPVVGALFRSTGYQKEESELVMIVTAKLAAPIQGRAATPADRYVPPSDFELFLFGAQKAMPPFATKEDRALMAVDPAKGGLEGGYGHILH